MRVAFTIPTKLQNIIIEGNFLPYFNKTYLQISNYYVTHWRLDALQVVLL